MEKKKAVPVWASVILLIIVVELVALDIIGIVTGGLGIERTEEYFDAGIQMLSVILAAIYCLKGPRKSASVFFKAVIILRLISSGFSIFVTCSISNYFGLVCAVLTTACLAVLAFVKDLGKVRSLAIAVAVLAIDITGFSQRLSLTLSDLRFTYSPLLWPQPFFSLWSTPSIRIKMQEAQSDILQVC